MSEDTPKTGLVASGVLHAALLAFVLVGFASAPKFEDASESTPVDTVTKTEFEQAMGERAAKAPPATQPAKPAPPQPPQPPPDLRKSEDTPPPVPPVPPPKPEPPKPEPPKLPVKPAPPPPKPAPPPPPKPDALETPQPPVKPKIVDAQPPERPRETPPEKPVEKPKPDPLAKLLAEETAKEPVKSSAKPYDPRAIAKLIGETKPAAPSTGTANPGAPNAHAQRMSGSQERQLDDWFKDAYMACWSPPPTTPEGDVYIPEVQVTFNADGTLSGQPVLVNPPPDPAWRAHAESAVRAALRCNPMKIPAQYSPFFEQWRTKTIHFDPREALG